MYIYTLCLYGIQVDMAQEKALPPQGATCDVTLRCPSVWLFAHPLPPDHYFRAVHAILSNFHFQTKNKKNNNNNKNRNSPPPNFWLLGTFRFWFHFSFPLPKNKATAHLFLHCWFYTQMWVKQGMTHGFPFLLFFSSQRTQGKQKTDPCLDS